MCNYFSNPCKNCSALHAIIANETTAHATTLPDVDTGVIAWTLHGVRLAGASLTVRQDADVVPVDTRRHQRLRVFVHLSRTAASNFNHLEPRDGARRFQVVKGL